MIEEAQKILLSAQNSDGGWGATQGKRSSTETTSLALLALHAWRDDAQVQNLQRGMAWLLERQHANGSWPLNDTLRTGSWTTSLAILALNLFREHDERVDRAARWVLTQEGSKPGLLAELILALTGKQNTADLNRDLIGWSWTPWSFSWVEPTSYALLALKKVRDRVTSTNIDERIKQGELMIYDRMCQGGGWNHGNSKVMGEALWPYPDITAIALIALQNRAAEPSNQQSMRALLKMLQEVDSGLALSWGMLCLSLYGHDTTVWKKQIVKRFNAARFLGEIKTVALALIAMAPEQEGFHL